MCMQPFAFANDNEDKNVAANYLFWGADNGFGIRTVNGLYQKATGGACNVTLAMRQQTVSTAKLNAEGNGHVIWFLLMADAAL